MNTDNPHVRSITGFIAVLVLAQLMLGCASNRAVTSVTTRQVDMLKQQALAEQIAPGREAVVTSVESPPNMTGKWHWHPSETFHYYLAGRVEIEFRDGSKIVGVPGRVNHVPYGAWHRATTGEEGVRLIIFRVHQTGEPVRHLEEHAHATEE
ncbi:MAG: cupin domain-containing protein [Phycisphaerales bacterium]|nr:cupin domain-containing protein [Phycisphaerales bacterium]